MALVYITNEHGEIIDQVDFEVAIKNNLRRAVSRVFVFDGARNVLLQKRTNTVLFPGTLCESAGGHVDDGDTFEITATKEMYEEIGLQIPLIEAVPMVVSERIAGPIYKGLITDTGTVNYDPDEVADVIWFSPDELTEKTMRNPEAFIPGFPEIWQTHQAQLLK